jgi:hypothetical protein
LNASWRAANAGSYEQVADDLTRAHRSTVLAAPLWIDWYATALRALEADGRFDEQTCREAARAYADRMAAIFGGGDLQ